MEPLIIQKKYDSYIETEIYLLIQWGNSGGWITQHPEYVITQTNGNGKEGQIQTTGSGGTGGGIRGGGFKGQNGGNTRGSKGTGSGTRTGQRGRQAFQQQSTQAQPIQAQ